MRRYELTNHLGNVLSVISDKRYGRAVQLSDTVADHYVADVVRVEDYYPFGMGMPGRAMNADTSGYRYGFNGKEDDGETGTQDYGMRIYKPELGRFLSVDPLYKSYPWYTPYQFAGNKPVWATDIDGLEENTTSTYVYKAPALDAPTKRTIAPVRNTDQYYADTRTEYQKQQAREDAIWKNQMVRIYNTPEGESFRIFAGVGAAAASEIEGYALAKTFSYAGKAYSVFSKTKVGSYVDDAINAFKNSKGTFARLVNVGDDLVEESSQLAWRTHEVSVTADLRKTMPNTKVGEQVTIDVYGPGNQMVTIRADNVYQTSNGSYQLVDAKFSQSGSLLNGSMTSSFTENQKLAYNWIKNGQLQAAIVRGEKAVQMGLTPGTNISLTNQVQIAINIPQNAQNAATYGNKALQYRTY
jgi:RHS repeat-associated protein